MKELAGLPRAREGWRRLRAVWRPLPPVKAYTHVHTHTHTRVCTQGHAHTARTFRKAGLQGSRGSAFQKLSERSAPYPGGEGGRQGPDSLRWVIELLGRQAHCAGFS